MAKISDSSFHILERAETMLRTNWATVAATVNGEQSEITVPTVGAGDIGASDDRDPPQNRQYVHLSCRRVSKSDVFSRGNSRSEFELVVVCGVMNTRRSANDQTSTVVSAGVKTAALMNDVALTLIERHLPGQPIYNVYLRDDAPRRPANNDKGTRYEHQARFRVFMRTYNARLTA